MWSELRKNGVLEQTLVIVCAINGHTEQTLLDVLYAHTGYRSFEQMHESEGRTA